MTGTPPDRDNDRAIVPTDDVEVLVSAARPIQPVRRRIPGSDLRPQAEARQAVVEEIDRRTVAIEERWADAPAVVRLMKHVHVPKLAELTRWKLQLDCGCITESFTARDELPHERQVWGAWSKLNAGERECFVHGDHGIEHHRKIVSWGELLDDLPPDPVRRPMNQDYWTPELWKKVRRRHPRAVWKVTLSCGHTDKARVAELDWTPNDGHTRREIPEDEFAAVLRRIEEMRRSPLGGNFDYLERSLLDGEPEPQVEAGCITCCYMQRIVAYQSMGPLPRANQEPPQPDPREALQRRLDAAEREAARLRQELADLGQQATTDERHDDG
jgi:hypothetical protein